GADGQGGNSSQIEGGGVPDPFGQGRRRARARASPPERAPRGAGAPREAPRAGGGPVSRDSRRGRGAPEGGTGTNPGCGTFGGGETHRPRSGERRTGGEHRPREVPRCTTCLGPSAWCGPSSPAPGTNSPR